MDAFEQPISLSTLIAALPEGLLLNQVALQDQVPLIHSVRLDSRQVQPGDLFVALSGGNVDGHRFIQSALTRGAAAVVGTETFFDLPVPYLQVRESRLALAYLAAARYDFPARKMTMIGVTGTDGKTTTSNLIFQILKTAGLKVGMISTVNAIIGDQTLDTGFHVTTPESPDVQRYLALMQAAGLTHVILEATSHGLAQNRVAACDFDLGVVTNITHEHLDYHGSYEAYRAAKGSLFAGLGTTPEKPFRPPRGAVLNQDDSAFDYLKEITSVPILAYGLQNSAGLRAEQIELLPNKIRFEAVAGQFRIPVECPLVGRYNVYNCLAAIGLTHTFLGIDTEAIQAGVLSLPGVPGRMERIEAGQNFIAIVDFAHTPNALKSALQAARTLTQGQVIAVFGSAGLRDREKRRLMAETSAELADLTVLTAEDPRTESLEQILQEMATGAAGRGGVEGQTFWRVADRGEAIRFALRLAKPGDVVIACGKGHEQSMCFGETEYRWDDRDAMRAALAEYLGQPGPAMPYLPTQGK